MCRMKPHFLRVHSHSCTCPPQWPPCSAGLQEEGCVGRSVAGASRLWSAAPLSSVSEGLSLGCLM